MRKRILAACLAAAVLPSVAAADDYYLRASAGSIEPSSSDFDSSQAWTLGAGWRFNRFLSVEGGYNDLGQYSAPGIGGPVNVDVTSLELGVAAKIPFGKSGLFGQGRAGAHRWESQLESFAVSDKLSGTDAYYGLAIGYDFEAPFSVIVSYERYGWDNADLDRLMVGIEIR